MGCASGSHDGGHGQCYPLKTCAAGYQDDGGGTCTPQGQCLKGFTYYASAATGSGICSPFRELAARPTGVSTPLVLASNGRVYVTGGADGSGGSSASFTMLGTSTAPSWVTLPAPGNPLTGWAQVNATLFGNSGANELSYTTIGSDGVTDTWSSFVYDVKQGASLVALGSRLYLLGGLDVVGGIGMPSTSVSFATVNGSTPSAPVATAALPSALGELSVAVGAPGIVVGAKFYGGGSDQAKVFVGPPDSGGQIASWRTIQLPQGAFISGSLALAENRLFATSVNDSGSYLWSGVIPGGGSVFSESLETPIPRGLYGISIYANRIYLVGSDSVPSTASRVLEASVSATGIVPIE